MADVTALLAMPVNDRKEAEAFISALHAAELDYHFEDGAVDCLYGNGLVTEGEASAIDAKIDACYAAWAAPGANMREDCPIGYLLELMDAIEKEPK